MSNPRYADTKADPRITDIKARIQEEKDDFADGYTSQSIRDREYLLAIVEDQNRQLGNYAKEDAEAFVRRMDNEKELHKGLAADKAEEDHALEAKTKWAKENFGAVYRGTERIA